MKKNRWISLLGLAFLLTLSACGSILATPEPIPTITLDTNAQAELASHSGGVTVAASAIIVPVDTVQLSFPLVGSVVEVLVEAGDTVKAGDTLVQLDTAILQAKVEEAEASRIKAETQVSYLQRINDSSNEDIEAAQAEVSRQQALIDLARKRLSQATLHAPIGGTIASVDISVGETVVPGLIIISLGDLSKMQLETTDLSEDDVPQVKVGQTVNVYIDALERKMEGSVGYIDAEASSIGGDVVYEVLIELDGDVSDLKWGMSAEVDIVVAE